MFRYIFLLILISSSQIPALLYGTPKWLCNDPKGCPIVDNTCPTCILSPAEETPIQTKIIHTTNTIFREVIREVPVPTLHIIQVAIPPSISFSNPKVQLASLSRETTGSQWSWSAKVASFICVGTRIAASHRGTFRCNGESTEYFITFFK
jgi:hypothetical protein